LSKRGGENTKKRRRSAFFLLLKTLWAELFSAQTLVGNGQLLASFRSASSQYAASVGGGHSLSETMLVSASLVGGLKCSFHLSITFILLAFFEGAKVHFFLYHSTINYKKVINSKNTPKRGGECDKFLLLLLSQKTMQKNNVP
jgi:hypothetical protein